MIIKNSQFDNNEDGFDTNSQNGDNPPPQNGACPDTATSPITHTHSCWVFENNYVHDNNNPNVPSAGAAAAGPVGTGMTVSGDGTTRSSTTASSTMTRGEIAIVSYPDSGPPLHRRHAELPLLGNGSCLYDDWGNALLGNSFSHRRLREPDQRGLRAAQPGDASVELLRRQHRHERPSEQRRGGVGDQVSDLLTDVRFPQHQCPVPERGPV